MKSDLLIKVVLVLAGVGLVVYLGRKASGAVVDVVGDAVNAVNPWNNDNVIYQTANQAVQSITGTPDTLGTWIYNALHPDEQDINGAYFNPPKFLDPYDTRFYRPPPQDVAGNFEVSPYAYAP